MEPNRKAPGGKKAMTAFFRAYLDADENTTVEVGYGQGVMLNGSGEVLSRRVCPIVALRLLVDPPVELCMSVPDEANAFLRSLEGTREDLPSHLTKWHGPITTLIDAVRVAVEASSGQPLAAPTQGNA